MNNKKGFFTLLTCGLVVGLSAGAFFLKEAKPMEGAKAETGPYSITDNDYEVAFLEQYNGGEEYGYTSDKPLASTSALGGHIYGDYGGNRMANFVTTLQNGINETLQWKFTCGRVKNDTAKNFITFGIESHGTTGNILDASAYPEGTDEYAIGKLTVGSSTNVTECSAMIMQSYINELNDFTVYWRSAHYGNKFAICYQIEGQEWKRLATAGNFSGGTRGWDANGYSTFSSESWTTKDLYKAKVKLAFAVTNAGSDHGNFRPSAILINASKAAVRYINALSYKEGVCTADTQYDLHLGQSANRHNQDLFQLATERADAATLQEYLVVGPQTQAYTALDLYNHLVGAIPALGEAKVVATNRLAIIKKNDYVGIIVVTTSIISITSLLIILSIKRKKHVQR